MTDIGNQVESAKPAIREGGDLWIYQQLQRVRELDQLLGGLPAFRRGRMYFDGKIRVAAAPTEGGEAC